MTNRDGQQKAHLHDRRSNGSNKCRQTQTLTASTQQNRRDEEMAPTKQRQLITTGQTQRGRENAIKGWRWWQERVKRRIVQRGEGNVGKEGCLVRGKKRIIWTVFNTQWIIPKAEWRAKKEDKVYHWTWIGRSRPFVLVSWFSHAGAWTSSGKADNFHWINSTQRTQHRHAQDEDEQQNGGVRKG